MNILNLNQREEILHVVEESSQSNQEKQIRAIQTGLTYNEEIGNKS